MLGNDLEHAQAASSNARPGTPRDSARWLETIESTPPKPRSPESRSPGPRKVDLAHATTCRAETIEALPPANATPSASEHFGVAVPAIVPPLRLDRRPQQTGSRPGEQPYPRFSTRVDIGPRSAHNFYAGFSSDIRAGGLFVATCAPFEAGEHLLLTFTVAGFAGAWSSRCVVDWTLPERLERQGGPPGMGLRLLDLDPQITAAINRFMRQRDPIFYEPR